MKRARRFTEQEKRAVVSGWSESGLSKRGYCAKLGVTPSSFYLWFKQYAATEKSVKSTEKHFDRFIPVSFKEEDQRPEPSVASSPVELIFPGGIQLRCTSDIDFDQLRKLIY